MNTGIRLIVALAASLALALTPASAFKAPKPAKTEMAKAVGKCVGTVLGGALLGALIGGKGDRAGGAAIGAGLGAAACAVIMAAAKRQDRIIAAQREAAAAEDDEVHWTSFTDENGKEVRIGSQAKAVQVAQTQALVPVSYKADGAERISPDLGAAPRVCRQLSSAMSADAGNATLPGQLYCRTSDGSYEPYALAKA